MLVNYLGKDGLDKKIAKFGLLRGREKAPVLRVIHFWSGPLSLLNVCF